MAFNQNDLMTAGQVQVTAANDQSPQVRLIAGPGTGKSQSIERRVCNLLATGVDPNEIVAVSYTRAAALDLRDRIRTYCRNNGQAQGAQVQATTLHSLALRVLRAAGILATSYPADPLVLDSWEVDKIFDAEFGNHSANGVRRSRTIRQFHEAFWSTGQANPPAYIPPPQPVTAAEQAMFNAFHRPRSHLYACVLPGELVQLCVQRISNGILNPVELLGIEHLIVDEFQDLNPMDLEFVDGLIQNGAITFVAGDDDQSIYSFRFASPVGIQNFPTRYPNTGQHTLNHCFRCPPAILNVAQAIILAYSNPNRVHKQYLSMYQSANPQVNGTAQRWQFTGASAEATAIADSCRDLIAAGLAPKDILILIGNMRAIGPLLTQALTTNAVPFESPRDEGFLDSDCGRFILSMLRIVCDPDDYVAHRVILEFMPGATINAISTISNSVIQNGQNFRNLFYSQPAPTGFNSRGSNLLSAARLICAQISTWRPADTLATRLAELDNHVQRIFGPNELQQWQSFYQPLPTAITLEELKNFLWVDNSDQQAELLQTVLERLQLPIPPAGPLNSKVRIMTMHGAKGLSAKVVFVPGLEEEIIPGQYRRPHTGLVFEAARLLYVSITRARAACVLSFANRRTMNGRNVRQTASQFTNHLNGPFASRTGGLTPVEITQIMTDVANL